METHFETPRTRLLNANGLLKSPFMLTRSVRTVSKHALIVGLVLAATGTAAQAPTAEPHGVAVLNALDKITARVSIIDARLNEPARFGTLAITVRACYQTPPEETPESTAYLEVVDDRPGAEAETVFSGWMFASSPAVSAMEHPVYDVSVISCKERLPDTEDGSKS